MGEEDSVKLMAFYLPQFHRIPENDKWWGKDFTEWTNVKASKPLFEAHYQPREPIDELGYYDLSEDKAFEVQARLAKEYGITGFCFYHYWFKGKKLLEKPVENFLKNKALDIKFCLCWDNESWKRTWYDDANNEVLMPFEYGSREDWVAHFNYLLPFFRDERALKVNGKPVFLIHRLGIFYYDIKDKGSVREFSKFVPEGVVSEIIKCWREEAVKCGLGGIYVVGCLNQASLLVESISQKKRLLESFGFDAVYNFSPYSFPFFFSKNDLANSSPEAGSAKLSDDAVDKFGPFLIDYDSTWQKSLSIGNLFPVQFEGAFVDLDTSPRKNRRAFVFKNFSVEKYGYYLRQVVHKTMHKPKEERIIFINAWNEWGEGAYLEPDKKNGYAILEATKNALKEACTGAGSCTGVCGKLVEEEVLRNFGAKQKLVEGYLKEFDSVSGWMSKDSVLVLLALDFFQALNGIKGSLAEIGVFLGKSFIPLYLLSNKGEAVVAIDSFDYEKYSRENRVSFPFSAQDFFNNVNKHCGGMERMLIIKGDSLLLSPSDLLECTQSSRVRIFSIDGNHSAQFVEHDLALADVCLADGGVIIMDDFFNLREPGVTEGFFNYFSKHDSKLKPFFFGGGRMVLAQEDYVKAYFDFLSKHFHPLEVKVILGSPCLVVRPS